MPEAKAFRRAGCGKSARPVRRGERHFGPLLLYSRATRSERSPLPSRGEPRAADGEAFSEGLAKDFGALGFARGVRNPNRETEAGCRRKCFKGAPPGVGIRPEAEPRTVGAKESTCKDRRELL